MSLPVMPMAAAPVRCCCRACACSPTYDSAMAKCQAMMKASSSGMCVLRPGQLADSTLRMSALALPHGAGTKSWRRALPAVSMEVGRPDTMERTSMGCRNARSGSCSQPGGGCAPRLDRGGLCSKVHTYRLINATSKAGLSVARKKFPYTGWLHTPENHSWKAVMAVRGSWAPVCSCGARKLVVHAALASDETQHRHVQRGPHTPQPQERCA